MVGKCPICGRRLVGRICPIHGSTSPGPSNSTRGIQTLKQAKSAVTAGNNAKTAADAATSAVTALDGVVDALGVSLTSSIATTSPQGIIREYTGTMLSIGDVSVANPTHITSGATGFATGTFRVYIHDSVGTYPTIDGTYTATAIDTTHWTIPVNVTSAAGESATAIIIPTGWSGYYVPVGSVPYKIKYTG
jgi:hypothetical protein